MTYDHSLRVMIDPLRYLRPCCKPEASPRSYIEKLTPQYDIGVQPAEVMQFFLYEVWVFHSDCYQSALCRGESYLHAFPPTNNPGQDRSKYFL